ncbi:Type II secretion system protein [Trichinella pseudospiralis]
MAQRRLQQKTVKCIYIDNAVTTQTKQSIHNSTITKDRLLNTFLISQQNKKLRLHLNRLTSTKQLASDLTD